MCWCDVMSLFYFPTISIRFEHLVPHLIQHYLFNIFFQDYTHISLSFSLMTEKWSLSSWKLKLFAQVHQCFFLSFCFQLTKFRSFQDITYLNPDQLSRYALYNMWRLRLLTMCFPSWSTYLHWSCLQRCVLSYLTDALVIFTRRSTSPVPTQPRAAEWSFHSAHRWLLGEFWPLHTGNFILFSCS